MADDPHGLRLARASQPQAADSGGSERGVEKHSAATNPRQGAVGTTWVL